MMEVERELVGRNQPRLAYVADVPVESFMHGSLLMFRLLSRYPSNRLTILELFATSHVDRRLPNVAYGKFGTWFGRARRTRFSPLVDGLLLRAAANSYWLLNGHLRDFQPDAILTVANGLGCILAARYAMARKLPLHLIAHDDPRRFFGTTALRNWADTRLAQTYRYASSRLCVSPAQELEYRARYGVRGTVLYPARGDEVPAFTTPSVGPAVEPFTVGFAGNVFFQGQLELLVRASHVLAEIEGRLVIYGPHQRERLQSAGMNMNVVTLAGTLRPNDLVERMRSDAHALLLPWSFASAEVASLALSFPSKLTDYTAAGLPIVMWGPHGNPVDVWSREAGNAVISVTAPDDRILLEEFIKLRTQVERRLDWGARSLTAGLAFFSADRAFETFQRALEAAPSLDPQ